MTIDDNSRYRDIRDVVDRILSDDEFPEGPVYRLEVSCLASGEATWRVETPALDEPVGGYLEPLPVERE